MSTITISPSAYAQAEAYAESCGLTLSEAVERAISSMHQRMESARRNNPSPSGDPWWNDPENVAKVDRALEQQRQGLGRIITREEIPQLLGL